MGVKSLVSPFEKITIAPQLKLVLLPLQKIALDISTRKDPQK